MPLCWWLSPVQENQLMTRSPTSPVRPKWARTMGRYMGHALQYQKMLYSQYPQQVHTLLLLEQPHISTSWLQSLPESYTNPRPEMDDSHDQQHHKEGQLHHRLLAQKPSVLPPSCRKTAYISLVRSALEYSAVVWDPYQQNDIDKLENIQRCAARFINQNYKDCTHGCVTTLLRDLGLQSLHKRWKQQCLTLFCKIVRGLTPAIPANEFLTPVNFKRLIKPRSPTDGKTTNIVIDHARTNSHSYRVDPSKTAVYRYSFCSRTTIDWNNLEQEIVSSKTSDSFKTQISRCP